MKTKMGNLIHRASAPGRRGRGAFTLIELLIVIFIIAILVALVVGVGRYVIAEGARKQTVATEGILMNAIQAFYDEYHQYPPDGNDPNAIPLVPNELSGPKLWRYLTGNMRQETADGVTYTDYSDLKGALPTGTQLADENARIRNRITPKLSGLPRDAYTPDKPYFMDGYGHSTPSLVSWQVSMVMRYSSSLGKGGGPVLISCGADGSFGWGNHWGIGGDVSQQKDNIRSDGK